ncbi:DedA family protein [Sphingobium sufflavum]|uniref:DedA family protein n=1 Tax=Sphingobium sufflavum TaxID=1129547 RepID=UPI001F2C4A70|nr:DedA family protein [Sphingobium sufflavum]MCE7795907.1 DedA family protein [Sphingobium sufflavum]
MTEWIVTLIDAGGYWGIALLMVIENVFPPIPSELIMGIGGIRVGQGRMDMLPLLIFATIGSTLGNYVWYLIGRALGFHRLRPLVDRWGRVLTLEWRDVRKINLLFRKYGPGIVFVFRFMPAFRTMVSLPAGLFRMGHVRFLIWTAAGALIWNIILAGGGWWLGSRITRIDDYLGPVSTAVVVLAVVAYVWRFLTWKPYSAD